MKSTIRVIDITGRVEIEMTDMIIQQDKWTNEMLECCA